MADYSEFPTTPTAWQEIDEWPMEAPPAPTRRRVDPVALVPGVFFSLLAIVLLTGVQVPLGLFDHGGVLWLFLIGAGLALLVRELRRARRRQ